MCIKGNKNKLPSCNLIALSGKYNTHVHTYICICLMYSKVNKFL